MYDVFHLHLVTYPNPTISISDFPVSKKMLKIEKLSTHDLAKNSSEKIFSVRRNIYI